MKKIFTFLFAVGIVSIASAQSRGFDNHRQDNVYSFGRGHGEFQQINREYDYKIAAVKMDRHLNRWEKSREIRFLEHQRMAELDRAKHAFNRYDDRFNEHKYADNNRHKW